jgi:hypothetical protein
MQKARVAGLLPDRPNRFGEGIGGSDETRPGIRVSPDDPDSPDGLSRSPFFVRTGDLTGVPGKWTPNVPVRPAPLIPYICRMA